MLMVFPECLHFLGVYGSPQVSLSVPINLSQLHSIFGSTDIALDLHISLSPMHPMESLTCRKGNKWEIFPLKTENSIY